MNSPSPTAGAASAEPLADLIRRTARERFDWDELRPGQLEAISALVEGHDVLVVMPTGAGKSAVYQVAALLLDGPTVVVSPLISLQLDQLAGLAEQDTPEAVAVNSAQKDSQLEHAWKELHAGKAEFVFLSPEQLANEEVVERLAGAGVSLLAVDEAHCVSSWGHDFRPDYLRIGDVLERLGRPTVAALTATASPPVREEVVERLRMREPLQVVRGFDRPNLELRVQRFADERGKRDAVVDRAATLPGPGLVYTATRKDTERYAAALADRGLRAEAYHAGRKAADRQQVHEDFLAGNLDVVVATSAFGMGIDKPDVRFVLHADVSDSLDSYYQEIGRAGRDGEPALAQLLYRSEDLGLRKFFASGGPDGDTLTQVAAAVRRHDGPTPPTELEEELSLSHTRLTNAVNLLEQAGSVEVTDRGELEYPDGSLAVDEAVEAAEEVAHARQRLDRSRVEMMRGYAETTGCRRQFLLGYFGEELPEPCGNCDTCADGSAMAADPEADAAVAEVGAQFPLNARVRHREWGAGVVMRPEADRVTVLFEQVGYRTLAIQALDGDPELLQVDDAQAG
ncbi:MAG TPA: ATP-dependent DNA helicase RecQ [Actinomycetales bacterium]|nr:ATP-dependent DNA helicase RecQ [Actinomycetales bacterium]